MNLALKSLLILVIGTVLVACGNDDDNDDDNNENSNPIDITLLHINDHHSHLEQDDFDYNTSSLTLSATDSTGAAIPEVEVNYGGFPRLVTLFNELKASETNPITLHAGDAITGTLYYSLFAGEADAAMMNQVCFDAFALGNHEFDDGDAGLAKFLDFLKTPECDTPVLSANVVPASTSAIAQDYIEPYTIKDVDGEKIGIIGIDIADKTKNSSQPDEGTEFLDETTTAQQTIDELTSQGVNKIILLTHYQYSNDLLLAANLTGVDVIVGGDSHTLLGDDTFENVGLKDSTSGDYPTIVQNLNGNNVCVVQAWEYSHLVGKLNVSFDADGVVTSCSGEAIAPIGDTYTYEFAEDDDRTLDAVDAAIVTAALTAEDEIRLIEADTATTALLADFNGQVSVLEQTVIGSAAEDLCLERIPNQGRSSITGCQALTYNTGSDISNIVAKAFMTVTPTADIGIQNGGGVRVDVVAGDYTIADAFTLLPFSNTLVTLDMTGQQVKDVLEDALESVLNGGSTGAYPYASGLRYRVDASQAFGSRISALEVNPRVGGTWEAIKLTQVYTVVTNDFIASGRDGYTTFGTLFSAGEFVDTFTEYAQGFIDYVEGLTANGEQLQKLPADEYSTQNYINTSGCDHGVQSDCTGSQLLAT